VFENDELFEKLAAAIMQQKTCIAEYFLYEKLNQRSPAG